MQGEIIIAHARHVALLEGYWRVFTKSSGRARDFPVNNDSSAEPGSDGGAKLGGSGYQLPGNLPTLKPLGTPAVVIPFAKVNGIYPNIDKNCETSDRSVGWVRRGWGRKASAAGVTGSVARMRRRQSGRVEKNKPERHWPSPCHNYALAV